MSQPGDRSSEASFELYVVPEIEVLLRVARSLTRHRADAEDLVQDTLIHAYKAIDRFDGRHPRLAVDDFAQHPHQPQPSSSPGADA